MANEIPLHDWLKVLDDEYLSAFIADGGASIKFAVTSPRQKLELTKAMESRCRDLNYVVVKLDAAETKVHMPQDIFFEMASQVDWRLLARRLILRLAKEGGYQVDNVNPRETDNNIFEAVANVNNLDSQFVLQALRPKIQNDVFFEYRMTKDFRVAMTRLCQSEENSRPDQYGGQPLIDWLTGTNTKVSSVKSFFINTAINRVTARHFIESALFWFRHTGCGGTVVLLDNSRVAIPRNPRDGLRYYTRAMVMDHYELLREFVDGTDHLTGALLLILTDRTFTDSDAGSRGFGMYKALETRIMDDVRDKNLVNPLASLVRIS